MLRTVRNTLIPKNKLLLQAGLLLFVALLFASPGFASINPCTAPATPTTLTTYQPSSPLNGCSDGNLQFTNFTIGTIASSYTVSSAQCGGTTCVIPLGTATPADPSTVLISADTPFGPHLASTSVGGSTCKSSGVGDGVGFCSSEGPGNPNGVSQVTQLGFVETALNGTMINFIGLAATLVSHSSGKGGATAIVFEEYCPGTTTFSQGCAGGGTLSVGIVQGQFTTFTASAGAGFTSTTTVAVRDTVWLATIGAAGEWASMDSADAIVPEPATYSMVGLAFLGLGVLKFKRKKIVRTPQS